MLCPLCREPLGKAYSLRLEARSHDAASRASAVALVSCCYPCARLVTALRSDGVARERVVAAIKVGVDAARAASDNQGSML